MAIMSIYKQVWTPVTGQQPQVEGSALTHVVHYYTAHLVHKSHPLLRASGNSTTTYYCDFTAVIYTPANSVHYLLKVVLTDGFPPLVMVTTDVFKAPNIMEGYEELEQSKQTHYLIVF